MARKKFKLEGMLNSPNFIKKEQERLNIEVETEKIPLNEIMGVEEKKEEVNFDFEQIKHENKLLQDEIEELKGKLEKVSGPKKDLLAKYTELEKENAELKSLLDQSSNEVNDDTNS